MNAYSIIPALGAEVHYELKRGIGSIISDMVDDLFDKY